MEDRIYDTVDEDEYEVLIAKRCEEAKGFMVDNNGLGYNNKGQEEDWSLASTQLSEESEWELEGPKRKNNNNKSNLEKKEQQMTKKPLALSAAAALIGKQRISNMFTSSVFKKIKNDNKVKNLSCDSVIDDAIAKFALDEADRERRRRGNSNLRSDTKSLIPITSHVKAIIGEKPVTHSISLSVTHKSNGFYDTHCEPLMLDSVKSDFGKEKDFLKESPNGNPCNSELEEDKVVDMSNCSGKEIGDDKNFSNEVEAKVEPVAKLEKEKTFRLNVKIKEDRAIQH